LFARRAEKLSIAVGIGSIALVAYGIAKEDNSISLAGIAGAAVGFIASRFCREVINGEDDDSVVNAIFPPRPTHETTPYIFDQLDKLIENLQNPQMALLSDVISELTPTSIKVEPLLQAS